MQVGTTLVLLRGMNTNKAVFNLLTATSLVTSMAFTPSVTDASKFSGPSTRIAHAKELLGGTYKKSVVRHSEDIIDISDFVEAMVEKFLPKKFKKQSRTLATAIMRESEKHDFDPLFLVSIIQNESSFNPQRKGSAGEIGLMQIKPSTAKWIAQKSGIKYKNDKALYNPAFNVKIGAAFMAMLREQFDSHGRLYMSAYNMGAKKVRNMVAQDKMPAEYVGAVMKRYIAMYSAFKHDGDTAELATIAYDNVRDSTKKRNIASN